MEDNKDMKLENNDMTPETPVEAQSEAAEAPAAAEITEVSEAPEASAPAEDAAENSAEIPAEEPAAAETPVPETPAQKRTDWKKELREWVVSIGVALLIVFVVRTWLFTLIRVDGDSMYSTLNDGERLFVTIADVRLFGAERGDVVICHYPNRGNTYFVKRVVGVPGDQVERVNGVTYVIYTGENGETVREAMDESRALYYPNGGPADYAPYTLGEDEFFVVGDNRYNSHDSRDWNDMDDSNDVGPISGDMIIGQAQFVIWPPDGIRSVK